MSLAIIQGNRGPQWNSLDPFAAAPAIDPFRSAAIGPGQIAQHIPFRAPSPILQRPRSPVLGRPPSPLPPMRPPSPILVPMGYPSPMPQRGFPQMYGKTKTLEKKLDSVTRSRNALIITTIILAAGFLASFITLLVITFPPPSLLNVDVQVISTRTDVTYNTADHTNSNNYAYKEMQTTMCNQIIAAASTQGTIKDCTCTRFEDNKPGLKAYLVMNVALDGKSGTDRITGIGEAIVRAAAVNSDWQVSASDISVLPKSI